MFKKIFFYFLGFTMVAVLAMPGEVRADRMMLTFFEIDKNKDMLIDRNEFSQTFQGIAFIPFDQNNDNVIDFQEWKSLANSKNAEKLYYEGDEGPDERLGLIQVGNKGASVIQLDDLEGKPENVKKLFIYADPDDATTRNPNDYSKSESAALLRVFSYDF